MSKSKNPMPAEAQTRVLRRIAQNGGVLMLTHDAESGDRYSDQLGITVPKTTAHVLIRRGWVIAERDSMFDLTPQSWRVKRL